MGCDDGKVWAFLALGSLFGNYWHGMVFVFVVSMFGAEGLALDVHKEITNEYSVF